VTKKRVIHPIMKKAHTKVHLTSSGQHPPTSGRCISTQLNGKPCQGELPKADGVPYCASCRKTGDPSLRVCDHPKFGKILIAVRKLPKAYYMVWWGDRTTEEAIPKKHMEWALDTGTHGMIDARPYQGGSLMQFCACPGPSELTTVWMGPRTDCLLKRAKLTGMLFTTRMPVPKNHQLVMMYNLDVKTTDEFFAERGLVRSDVGTRKYPTLKKKNVPAKCGGRLQRV